MDDVVGNISTLQEFAQQNNQNQILSPAVRKIVEEKNIDLAKLFFLNFLLLISFI